MGPIFGSSSEEGEIEFTKFGLLLESFCPKCMNNSSGQRNLSSNFAFAAASALNEYKKF